MSPLPEKDQQIRFAHAGLIGAVVMACQNRDRRAEIEPLLAAAVAHGWGALAGAIRRILDGERDPRLLAGLDEEDRVIIEAILGGLQDPSTLPQPGAGPEPGMAAPGLAAMIQAAATGNALALQQLAGMAEQMLAVGGDFARLSAILRRLVNGERDPDLLCRGMTTRGSQLVLALLDELAKQQTH